MKQNKLILIVGIALFFSSCKKTYLDVNTNPNTLTSSTPDYVFTSGVNRAASILSPNETGEYWSGHWTQSSTYIYDAARFSYNFNNTNFNFWDTWYDVLEDFQYVLDNADAKGLPMFKGPAKVMKAYLMQQIVDCYGNAPYTDAFKGSASIAPKFDDQKAIYADLIPLLDGAITDLRANAFTGSYGAADIVFKGNTANWIRFANSLKLRILIRQSRVASSAAYITTEINKANATAEGFLAIGQDVRSNPGYVASTGQTNPIYNNWGYSPTGAVLAVARFPRPTTFLFNSLISIDDTFRLKRLAYAKGGENPNNAGVSTQPEILSNYVPVPYGSTSGYLAQNTSYIGPSFIIKNNFNKDIYLMLAAESYFNLAEAKQLYGASVTLTGTAQSYYEQGVKEAYRVTGTPTSAATTILVNGKNLSDWAASTDKLKAIWFQKWLALTNFSGLEAWCDFRRTNYPVLPASAGAPVGQALPVRLFYPSTELASNGANVTAQGAIDVFTGRLFWDVD
jgi:Starch-binding associating with outer membrane